MKVFDYEDMPDDELRSWLEHAKKDIEKEMGFRNVRALKSGAITTALKRLDELDRLKKTINTPHTHDWLEAVPLEASHQINRWGTEQDDGKTPFDWFWLVGYLSQKAAASAVAGDIEKAKHHTISTGACLLNWFRRLEGDDMTFRPGIAEPQTEDVAA